MLTFYRRLQAGDALKRIAITGVEFLLIGVPIEHVAILLGHASNNITERHYAPLVKTRQASGVS